MRQKIKALTANLENFYSRDPWYGEPVVSILKGIDPKEALIKASGNAHNIAELLAHIVGWRDYMLSRISGDNDFKMEQDESFDWKRIDGDENTVWQSLLDKLDKNQTAVLNVLNEKEDDFLNMPVPGRNYNMQYLIEGTIQHDTYHLGQISLLKKMIGS